MTLLSIKEHLSLPLGWKEDLSNSAIDIFKVACDRAAQCSKKPVKVSHCLTIHTDLSWTSFLHGCKVDVSQCKAEATLNPSQVNKLLAKIESLNVCAGQPDARFMELCDARKGKF